MMAAVAGLLELDIDSIAAGGDGVGRANGLVVFVPRTAPGDRAQVRIQGSKRFARGALETVVTPAATRVDPPCPHYRVDRCGGCQLQHMRYDAQLVAKSRIVRDALERIAKRAVEPPEVRSSARQWRYRAKLTLTMRRRDREWIMGLHPYDDPAAIFQLADCPISDERVVATWREIMAAAGMLPRATELRGSVRLVGEGGARAVVIEGGTRWDEGADFFTAVPSASALWWKAEVGGRRLIAARTHTPAGASFAQINPDVATALREHVVESVLSVAPRTVVDAYAGSGDTAVTIAERGPRVTAIELDRDAAELAGSRLPADSRALVGRVEELLERALPADVVLVNPPRAGLDVRVTALLDRHAATTRAVVYVSCDPATLARDLTRLSAFSLASVVCFDMFPQTAHVETVCTLVPKGGAS